MLDITNMTVEAARKVARGCEYCHGEGLATIFHRLYDGAPYVSRPAADGTPRRWVTRTTAYCVCEAGRVIAMNHQKHSPDAFAKMKDLAEIVDDLANGREQPWSPDDPTDTHDPTASWSKLRAQMVRTPPVQAVKPTATEQHMKKRDDDEQPLW